MPGLAEQQAGTHWSRLCVEREWLAAAARAWSWSPCWGSWHCSCGAPVKVSDLGCSAVGRAPVLLTAGSRMRLSWKGMVSAKCAVLSPSSCHEGAAWLGLNRECPRQQGSVGQRVYLLCFVLHSSTKQPGLLPVLHQSASASVGPEGLHWTALQWGLRHPCHHVSYFLNFCCFFWHLLTLGCLFGLK